MERCWKLAAAAVLAGAVAACGPGTSSAQQGLLAGYDAAVAAELGYLNTPGASPVVARKLEADRLAAWAVVQPVVASSAPAAADVAAAQAALAGLDAYLAANGVAVTPAAAAVTK